MESKNILKKLREDRNFTQEEVAEKVFVTRQAVSRWENGETTPNVDTLKELSKLYDVSINTLLGSPRRLVCQCCGGDLDDSSTSREVDGTFNEEYCKWCYVDGDVVCGHSFEGLVEDLATRLSHPGWPYEAAKEYFERELPKLKYWKKKLGEDK